MLKSFLKFFLSRSCPSAKDQDKSQLSTSDLSSNCAHRFITSTEMGSNSDLSDFHSFTSSERVYEDFSTSSETFMIDSTADQSYESLMEIETLSIENFQRLASFPMRISDENRVAISLDQALAEDFDNKTIELFAMLKGQDAYEEISDEWDKIQTEFWLRKPDTELTELIVDKRKIETIIVSEDDYFGLEM